MNAPRFAIALLIVILTALPAAAFEDTCLSGDCQNGLGTLKFYTGHIYTGQFKDGQRDGSAVLLFPDGRKLTGVWRNNEITEGILAYPSGRRYVGQWKYRERSGEGYLHYEDGRIYVGEFENGRRNGYGMMVFPDGRRYMGEFRRGQRTGFGLMIHPDGRRETGSFDDGELTGEEDEGLAEPPLP